MKQTEPPKVFITSRESVCDECGEELGRHAWAIAEHACQKYSGRVGRTASAKSLTDQAVDLAVIAHIRHVETKYDQLLGGCWDRDEARANIAEDVRRIRAKLGC